jgi:hypothetical protein
LLPELPGRLLPGLLPGRFAGHSAEQLRELLSLQLVGQFYQFPSE